jgi:hypothetical protein
MALIIVATASASAFASTATTPAWASSTPTPTATKATTAAAAKASPSATAGAIRLRFSLIDLQCPSAEFGAVQGSDGFFGFAGVGHFNESKTARAAGFPVGDHADLVNGAVGLEKAA